MPKAPILTPDQIQSQAQSAQGINPTNFLIAAADMAKSGNLAQPPGSKLPTPGSHKRPQRQLKVLK